MGAMPPATNPVIIADPPGSGEHFATRTIDSVPAPAPRPGAAVSVSPDESARSTASAPASERDTLLAAQTEVIGRLPGRHEPSVPAYPGEYAEVGRNTIYVRRTPQAGRAGHRQAVFVHGLGGSARNWTDLMHLLEPVAAGMAPDLLGFGQSPMPADRRYSQQAHADAVINLIEDRCQGPVDLFGNSMGGAISIRIAAQRPELVRTLTLISPALPDLKPRVNVMPLLVLATPGVRKLAGKLTGATDPEKAVDRMYELCHADPGSIPADRRAEAIEETAWRLARPNSADPLRLSAIGLGESFLPTHGSYGWTLAGRIGCPSLAFFGTRDKLVDSRLSNRTAETIKGSRVVTLSGVGHVAQLERPELVAQMVLQMWADNA